MNTAPNDDDGIDATFELTDRVSAGMECNAAVEDDLQIWGEYHVECVAPDGTVKWEETFRNLVVDVGLNHALDVTLSGATQSSTWYLGLVDGSSSPTFAAGDTMSSHSGWTENTDYTAPRKTWSDGGVSSQSVDNSGSPATFNINATADIAGAFLVDDSTQGGSSGTLFAEGSFSTTRSAASGDTLNVTYTINAA